MTEEHKHDKKEEKMEAHSHTEKKMEAKMEEKTEHKHSEAKETKTEVKETKKDKKPKVKKEEAVAHGNGLAVSLKQGMAISRFIKGKPIDKAIAELEQVIGMKRAIPFKGEIPHRHGNMMSGRYPVNASKEFIYILKALRGNSIANGLELDNTRVSFASVSWASRPLKRGGRKAKRTNLILKAREAGVKK